MSGRGRRNTGSATFSIGRWVGWWCLLWTTAAMSQFPPAAGQPGSTAIAADSSVFVGWATGVDLVRGPRDVAQPDSGLVSFGMPTDALGPADGAVVSLGDGGTATLTFAQPVADGPGPDFAVFENSFSDTFLELAFVEVSSNGTDYVRFPATSLTQTDFPVGGFGAVQPTDLDNLAGKYRGGFGTPFDLSELPPTPSFDPSAVTHVRLVDCVGTLDPELGTTDAAGNLINEIYPSNFPSGGFDLDAVGVLHLVTSSARVEVPETPWTVFPNPVRAGSILRWSDGRLRGPFRLVHAVGQAQWMPRGRAVRLPPDLPPGLYWLVRADGQRTAVRVL